MGALTTFCAGAQLGDYLVGVQKSAYRQPVTPEGLKAIEEGKLTWLDDEMYNNLNTGVLEQYLEEKNLEESSKFGCFAASRIVQKNGPRLSKKEYEEIKRTFTSI